MLALGRHLSSTHFSYCLCRKKKSILILTAFPRGPLWTMLDLSPRLFFPSRGYSTTFVHVPLWFKILQNFLLLPIGQILKFLAGNTRHLHAENHAQVVILISHHPLTRNLFFSCMEHCNSQIHRGHFHLISLCVWFFPSGRHLSLPLKLPFLLLFQDSRHKMLPPLVSSSDLQRLNWIFLLSLLPKHTVSTFSIALVTLNVTGYMSVNPALGWEFTEVITNICHLYIFIKSRSVNSCWVNATDPEKEDTYQKRLLWLTRLQFKSRV